MKKIILILLLSLTSLVSSAWADVTLNSPEDIQIIAVNDKMADLVGKIKLSDGINQIALRFKGEIGKGNDTEIEYSDVFVIKFNTANQIINIKIPKIKNKFSLKKFNATPDIRLVNHTGTVLKIQVAKLEKAGLQIMRDFEQELIMFNRSSSPAALFPGKINMNQSVADHPEVLKTKAFQQNGLNVSQPDEAGKAMPAAQINLPEMMLKYWYRQADEQTQRKFKEWIAR